MNFISSSKEKKDFSFAIIPEPTEDFLLLLNSDEHFASSSDLQRVSLKGLPSLNSAVFPFMVIIVSEEDALVKWQKNCDISGFNPGIICSKTEEVGKQLLEVIPLFKKSKTPRPLLKVE